MNFNFFPHNPIAEREIRFYERNTRKWLLRLETGGVIVFAFALSVLFVIYWFVNKSSFAFIYLYPAKFDDDAFMQLLVGSVYGLTLVRCITAGVRVANRYQQFVSDEVLMTGLRPHTLIIGQWQGAVYQLRGWFVALALVRLTLVIVLSVNRLIYVDVSWISYNVHPAQLPLAISFAVLLSLLDIWATVGIGILAGTWIRNAALAWLLAILLRALPAMIFSRFPILEFGSYDYLVIRWQEYTWFAFADGGTSGLIRLAGLYWAQSGRDTYLLIRGLLSCIAAAHMLIFYGLISWILSNLRLHELAEITAKLNDLRRRLFQRRPLVRKQTPENLLIALISIGISFAVVWSWVYSNRIDPPPGKTFYYNPIVLNSLQVLLWLTIGLTTFRAMLAGVGSAETQAAAAQPRIRSMWRVLRDSLRVCRQIRGWFFGLGLILVTVFAVVVAEHAVNFNNAKLYDCLFSEYKYNCNYQYFVWPSIQWIIGLTAAISLSFAVLYSSAVLGVSARMILHRPAPALSFAILFRVIPVALTMLSPNAFIEPSYLDGVLRSTWNQNFIITLADTGVSALFGFAEPSWHTWHLGGTNISSALLASVLVFYMLLGYIVISLLLVYFLKNRTTNERSISAYRHRDQSASAQL